MLLRQYLLCVEEENMQTKEYDYADFSIIVELRKWHIFASPVSFVPAFFRRHQFLYIYVCVCTLLQHAYHNDWDILIRLAGFAFNSRCMLIHHHIME